MNGVAERVSFLRAPAFIKSKRELAQGAKGYGKVARLAAELASAKLSTRRHRTPYPARAMRATPSAMSAMPASSSRPMRSLKMRRETA